MNPAPTKKEFAALSLRVEEIDERVTALEAGKAAKAEKAEKKEKKEGPKREKSDWNVFKAQVMPQIKTEQPELSVQDRVKEAAAMYNAQRRGVNIETARAAVAQRTQERKSRAASRVASRATSRAASPNRGSASSKKSSAANLVRAAASKLNKTRKTAKVVNNSNSD